MKPRLIAMLLSVSIAVEVLLGQAKVATSGAQFLEIPVGARAEGMGGAFLAIADDPSAIYYNPAGIAFKNLRGGIVSHSQYVADMLHEFAGFTMPVAGGVAGISIIAFTTGEMDETTPFYPEGTGRKFTAGDIAAGLTYSRLLTDRFAVGVNAKYVGEYYADVSAHGWVMDVGTLFKTAFHNLRIGMKLSNFGPDLTFLSQSAPMPMAFHFGISDDFIFGNNRITIGTEGSHPNDNLEKYCMGIEYSFHELAFVRTGIKYPFDPRRDKIISGTDTTDYPGIGFSMGGGVKIPVSGMIFNIDYSYSDMGFLESVHRFTFSTIF